MLLHHRSFLLLFLLLFLQSFFLLFLLIARDAVFTRPPKQAAQRVGLRGLAAR